MHPLLSIRALLWAGVGLGWVWSSNPVDPRWVLAVYTAARQTGGTQPVYLLMMPSLYAVWKLVSLSETKNDATTIVVKSTIVQCLQCVG